MIDIVKESMNLLLADWELMTMLNNSKNAICRIRSPDINIKPRIEISLIDDADGDSYDNRPTTYGADLSVYIYKNDSKTFEIGSRVNEIFKTHGLKRLKNTDGYIYELDLYVKEMAFRSKIQIEGNDFSWLK